MDNIKKGFILIFVLALSFAPLAICWYLPLNQTWALIPDIPVILFLGWGSYRLLKKLPNEYVTCTKRFL